MPVLEKIKEINHQIPFLIPFTITLEKEIKMVFCSYFAEIFNNYHYSLIRR